MLKGIDKHADIGSILLIIGLGEDAGVNVTDVRERVDATVLALLFRKGRVDVVLDIDVVIKEQGSGDIVLRHITHELHIVLVDLVLDERVFHRGLRFRDIFNQGSDIDMLFELFLDFISLRAHHAHHRRHVTRLLSDGDRVAREHIVLHRGDISLDTRGEGKHKRDADDTNRAGKADHRGASALGEEVSCREAEGGEEGHLRLFLFLSLLALFATHEGTALLADFVARHTATFFDFLFGVEGVGVLENFAIEQADDTRRILLGKLGVMCYHDNQTLARNLADEVHNLHRGHSVECACRLVGEQDFRVIDQGARNRNTLALTARKLIGAFIVLVGEADAVERLFRATDALLLADARDGQGKLDITENGLVGNEVVALEDETDAVVAVDIPVAIAITPRGSAVDNQVARGVVVETADDVQQCGFSTARRT